VHGKIKATKNAEKYSSSLVSITFLYLQKKLGTNLPMILVLLIMLTYKYLPLENWNLLLTLLLYSIITSRLYEDAI
jgi:hypothetical protein